MLISCWDWVEGGVNGVLGEGGKIWGLRVGLYGVVWEGKGGEGKGEGKGGKGRERGGEGKGRGKGRERGCEF